MSSADYQKIVTNVDIL